MASSSYLTSSTERRFKYDVFISFRGEDTRYLVDHLYCALKDKGIYTYMDDEEIQKQEKISDDLIRSIEDSRFFIIVFSKNYASSSWSLDELVKIMECQKTTEQTAYPVFYDVEPTEVRKQYGVVGKAFARHDNKEEAGKWRAALKEAADLAGWELKSIANGHEAKFIQKIVEEISLELRSISFGIYENFVGMETRVQDIESSLAIGVNDVRMIGIKGMGGAGKSTLARAIFDRFSFQFEGVSFVENVREVAKSSLGGLRKLQKQILTDVLKDESITISSMKEGKNIMKKIMSRRKVLIVLDDVDHLDQLQVLAGEPNWFKPGSRIIITTRDEQILIAHKVSLIHDVNLLTHSEAIRLFSMHVFGRSVPIQEYQKLSNQFLDYAAGLPLTIKVLGSFLCGKDDIDWIDALERLKTIPLNETMKILELSYIGLEDDEKEIFLDVACFLKGWEKARAIRMLESCGFRARNGLRVLEQKSMIITTKTSQAESIDMHPHIEEMGKNIVRRLHPNEPSRHSRLWYQEEIEDILANKLGSEATEAIAVKKPVERCSEIATKGFGSMKNLRLLYIESEIDDDCDVKNNELILTFPSSLRFLSWLRYPYWSLPKTFLAYNLVVLELPYSRIKRLWEGGEGQVFHKLQYIDLSHSKLRTHDLGLTPNLETLNLSECHDLVELHVPIGCLKLRSIKVSHSKLITLDLRLTPNLEVLEIKECHDLVELHMPVECLNLTSLDLNHLKLSTFDLRLTPNLEQLTLEECHDLVELNMMVETPKLRSLKVCNSKLRSLDLVLTPKLELLDLQDCNHLAEIHMPKGGLKRLMCLNLSGCSNIKSFLFIEQLESLEVLSLTRLYMKEFPVVIIPRHLDNNLLEFRFRYNDIYELPSSIGNLQQLVYLDLHSCRKLRILPGSICSLRNLRNLKLYGCSLEELPKDIGQLECLEKLNLSFTSIKHLPDSICMLKNLKTLNLSSCWNLEKLPEDIGQLECLQKLILKECTQVRDVPDSICMLKELKYLSFLDCIQIQKLPEELGNLRRLEELNINGTRIRFLPSSILLLTELKICGPKSGIRGIKSASQIKVSEASEAEGEHQFKKQRTS